MGDIGFHQLWAVWTTDEHEAGYGARCLMCLIFFFLDSVWISVVIWVTHLPWFYDAVVAFFLWLGRLALAREHGRRHTLVYW